MSSDDLATTLDARIEARLLDAEDFLAVVARRVTQEQARTMVDHCDVVIAGETMPFRSVTGKDLKRELHWRHAAMLAAEVESSFRQQAVRAMQPHLADGAKSDAELLAAGVDPVYVAAFRQWKRSKGATDG